MHSAHLPRAAICDDGRHAVEGRAMVKRLLDQEQCIIASHSVGGRCTWSDLLPVAPGPHISGTRRHQSLTFLTGNGPDMGLRARKRQTLEMNEGAKGLRSSVTALMNYTRRIKGCSPRCLRYKQPLYTDLFASFQSFWRPFIQRRIKKCTDLFRAFCETQRLQLRPSGIEWAV